MNDERTIYDNEKTQYQSQNKEVVNDSPADKNQPEQKKSKFPWKQVTIGATSGILLGAAATVLTSGTTIDHASGGEGNDSHPWADDDISIATDVNDDMSFSEAFAAARAEVGPGGAFEWHGQVYGTFLADEWNDMTQAQREEFGSHFSWNQHTSDYTVHTTHVSHEIHDISATGDEAAVVDADDNDDQAQQEGEVAQEDADDVAVIDADNYDEQVQQDFEDASDDVDVAAAEVEDGQVQQDFEALSDDVDVADVSDEQMQQDFDAASDDVDVADASMAEQTDDFAMVDAEPEVEILGVVHDDDSGVNVGGMVIDGQDVVLVDVDGDSAFDIMGADMNDDQQISENEFVDISEDNFTVESLDDASNMDDGVYASNDNDIDYTDDAGLYDA